MKFIDSKRLSPVIYGGDIPHELDPFHVRWNVIPESEKQYEEFFNKGGYVVDDDWWDVQEYRCRNGYTIPDAVVDGGDCFVDGVDVIWLDKETRYVKHLDLLIKNNAIFITGRHYFYLNFWKIFRLDESTGRKRVMNPRFADHSFENWTIRDLMVRKQKDNMWCKRRQAGYSEEEACNLAYDFLFHPESQGVVVAGLDFYNQNTFKFIKRGIRRLINTQFYITLARQNDDYILSKYTGSEIYSKTCKGNSEALSGLSPSKVLMEECGVWDENLVIDTREYLKSSIFAEGIKTGYIQYTSTGGLMADSIKDVHEMCYNPSNYDLLEFDNRYTQDSTSDVKVVCFVPTWKWEITDEDGNSIRQKGEERVNKERENTSAKKRYIAICQKPFFLEEMFNLSAGGYFGTEKIQLLNERFFFISSHREYPIERTGRLEWKNKKNPWEGVDFKDDVKGSCIIIEEPSKSDDGSIPLNLYLAGTDSYDQDEAAYSDSKGSISVKKRFKSLNETHNFPVAHLLERPKTSEGGAEIFYENCAKLCIYYNTKGMNNIEWSNPRIFDWFINHGFESLLMSRPELATANIIKKDMKSNRLGTDKSLKPHILAILADRLTPEYIGKMFIRRQIQALAKFVYDPTGKKYNCDITISMALMELADKEFEYLAVKEVKKEENVRKGMRVFRTDNQGIMRAVFV